MKKKRSFFISLIIAMVSVLSLGPVFSGVSEEVLDSIMTPDTVQTSIGTLKFLDGAPYPETAEKVYDYVDSMRGVDAFLKGIPGASVHMLIHGARVDVGAKEEIHNIIRDLSKEGCSIIVFSTELPEIINLCDRIILMYEGEIRKILKNHEDIDSEEIMHIITGGQGGAS